VLRQAGNLSLISEGQLIQYSGRSFPFALDDVSSENSGLKFRTGRQVAILAKGLITSGHMKYATVVSFWMSHHYMIYYENGLTKLVPGSQAGPETVFENIII